ncbi:MAG: fasciclin domain-containing protein [Acidimicrobiales bacterium]
MPSPRIRLAAVGLAVGLAFSAAACGSDTKSAATDTTTAPTTAHASLTSENFGPGCAAVPTSGAGSFAGMAQDAAATAASSNPALSTLVAAVTAAKLGDTLNGAGPFTIFAPSNEAFAKIPKATLDGLLADPTGDLTKILTYHVIAGKQLDAQQLADAGTEKTVNGADVTIARSGDTIEINGQSAVVCGNVETANATVQIIDTVLMPPS